MENLKVFLFFSLAILGYPQWGQAYLTAGSNIHSVQSCTAKKGNEDIDVDLHITIGNEVGKVTCPLLGTEPKYAAESCQAIFQCNPRAPDGYYWLATTHNGRVVIQEAHCDMLTRHCGVKGGWMRVAHINMTAPGAACPSNFRQITSPKPLCGKTAANTASCSSEIFPSLGIPYSKVCGQAVGYQYYSMDSFHGPRDINTYYVDGVSITHGSPRKHIWTYAIGLSDNQDYDGKYNCPCAVHPGPDPPSFVKEHYYCESGNIGPYENQYYIDDPLWDGKGCGSGNNCCSQSGLPWFCRDLPQDTTEYIEVRLCANEGGEEPYIEILELLVQ